MHMFSLLSYTFKSWNWYKQLDLYILDCMAPLAQDQLSAPASKAYSTSNVCSQSWRADSRQEKSANYKPGEKNHAENEPEIL